MNQASEGFDSRRYPTPRLLSIDGYDQLPLIDDSLSFKFPRFRQHSGRLVAVGRRVWELWSPNSSQISFYPGVPPPNLQLTCPPEETQRRFDGHLGPYDYTVSPQVLSEQRPWHGFILRQASGFKQQSECPEFALLHQNWRSISAEEGMIETKWIDALMFRLNDLDAKMSSCSKITYYRADLWEGRPLYPSVDEVVTLRRIRTFAVAVDYIGRVLRGIKDRAAWLVMAQLILADEVTLDMLRNGTVPPACDDYLGAWVNGSDERDAVWAMGNGMPCFVIHELSSGARSVYQTAPRSCDFLEGTDVLFLHPSQNGFDFIALRSGQVPSTAVKFPPIPAPRLNLVARDHDLSSAVTQGWTGPMLGVTMPPLPNLEPTVPTLLPMDEEEYDIESWKKLDPTDPRYSAFPLEYEVLDSCRVPWLKPPLVQPVQQSHKWSKWVSDDRSPSQPVMKYVGKRASHKRVVYYDRENFRELSFSKAMELPPGYVADVQIFRLPAPAILYVQKTDRGWRQRKASRWMYPVRMPTTVGRAAPQPKIASLALQPDPSLVGAAQDRTSLSSINASNAPVLRGGECASSNSLAKVSHGLVPRASVIDLSADDDADKAPVQGADADALRSDQGSTFTQRLIFI